MGSLVLYDHPRKGLSASETITLDQSRGEHLAWYHQFYPHPVTGGATSGTVAIEILRRGDTTYRPLKDQYGAAVVVNLASPEAYPLTGLIDGVKYIPSGLSGGDGTFGAESTGLAVG